MAGGQALGMQPFVLHGVLAVVAQHGGMRNRFGRHAMGEVLRHELRAGGGHIAHGAQRPGIAAGDAGRGGGHGGHHRAFLDALGRMVLVVDADIQQFIAFAREGRHRIHEPRAQRIGIDRELERRRHELAFGHERGIAAAQLVFQQRDLLHMQAQPAAGFGAGTGLTAQHQHLADALLQQFDALGHGRGRDVQLARRALEAAFAYHRGQGFQSGIVQHQFVLRG